MDRLEKEVGQAPLGEKGGPLPLPTFGQRVRVGFLRWTEPMAGPSAGKWFLPLRVQAFSARGFTGAVTSNADFPHP